MKIYHVYICDYDGPWNSSYFFSKEKAMEYYYQQTEDSKSKLGIYWDWDEIETEDGLTEANNPED